FLFLHKNTCILLAEGVAGPLVRCRLPVLHRLAAHHPPVGAVVVEKTLALDLRVATDLEKMPHLLQVGRQERLHHFLFFFGATFFFSFAASGLLLLCCAAFTCARACCPV